MSTPEDQQAAGVTHPQQAASTITGDERVDDVLARLDGLEGRPVSDHVEVYESVLTGLRDSLDGSPSA